ncbi:MAG: 3-oxoacyl-ACP reductase FabG [Methylacidiphilales bacterium]|nr:3-oxoacyl-ACP reductase FabG [Candidatus Methylacidiphilales bacterium]
MFTSFENKSVVVTGSSKGIGKGIAKVFAKSKAKVMIVGRNKEDSIKTVQELKVHGGTVDYFIADVTNQDQVEQLMRTASDKHGGIDILCANAGIFPQKPLLEMTTDDWDFVLTTNLRSCFQTVKAVVPYMQKKGMGRIIVTSSITGPVTGYPGWSHYAASKAGQLGFVRTASLELAKYNITVNAVLPGNILTEGLIALGEDYQKSMAATIPMNKLGSIEDIGYAALFFASKEAGYITGQTIIVDGGQILPESIDALNATK